MEIIKETPLDDGGLELTIEITEEEEHTFIRIGFERLIEEENKALIVIDPSEFDENQLKGMKTVELGDEEANFLVELAVNHCLKQAIKRENKAQKSTPEVHKKLWGSELWIANTPLYCGKILCLNEMFRCSIHYHKKKHETFHLLSGRIWMEVEDEAFEMLPGDSVTVPQGTKHRFTGFASEGSKILEVSTQHFEDDSYRVVPSGKVLEKEWLEIIRQLSSTT